MDSIHIDFTELRTSWTKYDIVQALDVIYSVDTIQKYKKKEAKINERILRSFLGINSLDDPIPDYWIEIQKYPIEKTLIITCGSGLNKGYTFWINRPTRLFVSAMTVFLTLLYILC